MQLPIRDVRDLFGSHLLILEWILSYSDDSRMANDGFILAESTALVEALAFAV
jgi:hypothetical protein